METLTTHWWFKNQIDLLYTNITDVDLNDLERFDTQRRQLLGKGKIHTSRPRCQYIYEIFLPFNSQNDALGLFLEGKDALTLNNVCHEVMEDVCDGRCFLLLNNCCEAWFDQEFIGQVVEYFTAKQIPLEQIIYFSNAANHASLPSGGMQTYHTPVFLKDHRRFYKMLPSNTELDHVQNRQLNSHSFLCYNYNHHAQRVLLMALLAREGILGQGLISMPAKGYRGTYLEAYEEYRDKIDTVELGLDAHWGQVVHNQLPLELIPNFSRSIQDRADNAIEQYINTVFSLVTETFFFRDEVHLTEKIYKPISFKHPFVLVSTPGSLAWLKSQGFKTFHDYWDESYDLENNHAKRLNSIVGLVKTITAWNLSQRQKFIYSVWPILEHNYQRLRELEMSDSWGQEFIERYGV